MRRVVLSVVPLLGLLAGGSPGSPGTPDPERPARPRPVVEVAARLDLVLADLEEASQVRFLAEVGRVAAETATAKQAARARERQRSVAVAAPTPVAATGDYVAPEGCMVAMEPKERKSVAEAHRCWDGLLARYSWNQSTAFDKLWCESGGNPYAVGRWVAIRGQQYRAEGLMQILPGGSHDPATNMAQAHAKYSAAGNSWSPWQC